MKTIKSILIASAFAVGTAFSIGSASAMTLDEIPNADVNLKVEKGVATLFGSVDSQLERHQGTFSSKLVAVLPLKLVCESAS